MLELNKVEKRYNTGKVLHHINMTLPDYGMIGIVGPSGCGKSTLLHIIGGIDQLYSGNVLYNGKDIKKNIDQYRNKYVSFIFQSLHLIEIFKVLTNIKLPLFFNKHHINKQDNELEDLYQNTISSLSLGQRQKIAYLRAVFCLKKIILCDEPTASLDPQSAINLMELLKRESQDHLVILVSHNENLVNQYCDEVYTMSDGHIVNHVELRQKQYNPLQCTFSKRIKFPHIKLALLSLKAYKKRTYQLILGLFISLLCVFSSITLSTSLEKQIYDYIYSLVPPSSISFKATSSIKQEDIKLLSKYDEIARVQAFLDDYELLGIGFNNKRYEESKTLFISDDSSPYEHLLLSCGSYPIEENEILLSLSTAKALNEDVNKLVGKKIYAFYKVGLNVISIEYRISGITNTSTAIDTLYQKENAYISLLEKQHHLSGLKSSLGIIYVHQDYNRSDVKERLEIEFKDYDFKETGLSTTMKVKDVLSKIKTVLYFFTFLAVLSSLFLIGEVMYLNVIQEAKHYAIMFCFGATLFDLIKIVLIQSFIIVFSSYILCITLFYQLIGIVNMMIQEMLLSETFKIFLSYDYLIVIFVCSIILVLMSMLFSIVHIYKMNIVDTLKK